MRDQIYSGSEEADDFMKSTYKHAGTAKRRASRTRPLELWVGLWVEKTETDAPALRGGEKKVL